MSSQEPKFTINGKEVVFPYASNDNTYKVTNEYVCWIDIMGTRGKMENSVNTCAVFMLKLHTAIMNAIQQTEVSEDTVKVYPVMDGAYITAKQKSVLEEVLTHIFIALGMSFLKETNIQNQFLVKAAIAYGPIIHGSTIADRASETLSNHRDYKNSLLFGLPMIQANEGEKKAPPFGIYVHESARAFSPVEQEPFKFKYLQWFQFKDSSGHWAVNKAWYKDLWSKIDNYFKKSEKYTAFFDYPKDRITEHSALAQQYFTYSPFINDLP